MKNLITLASLLTLVMTISSVDASAKTRVRKPKARKSAPARSATVPYSAEPSFSAPVESTPQNADVGAIKNRYWTRGDDSEIGVVQNRIYSKAGFVEVGAFGGLVLTDPFLSVKSAGGRIGYHFSEFLSLHALGWKNFSGHSSAYTDFETTRGAVPLVNEPKWFAGGEIGASLLYGKLSFLGKSIIYYDFHLLGGAGMTGTDNGQYLTPFAGFGQQIYLGQSVALSIDYRLMAYYEDMVETAPAPALTGQYVRSRWNWTNSITLGVTFLLGSSGGGQ
jgi:outer membrane beta-barrel protein